jgi:hypothetical protein
MAVLGSRTASRPAVALLVLAYFLAALPISNGIVLNGAKEACFTLDICMPTATMVNSPLGAAALLKRPAPSVILLQSGTLKEEPLPLRLNLSCPPQPPVPKA